ncbi:MAG TPA: hypothetical protein DCO75_02010 [Fibrobacteres bacterium]|nr:hypothetical protein [Fibrobacterota bacterium]
MNAFFKIIYCIGFMAFITFCTATENNDSVTIIASGETHAMLLPCDCPVNPGGGLAKRAYLINKKRDSGSVLLLDAGGFAGGGMYDSYTEGRVKDSLRTLSAMRAMALMNYDAVAIGDDDLAFGAKWLALAGQRCGLPIVSANCMNIDNTYVGVPYLLVKKGKLTFAITGLTTQERFSSQADSAVITQPFRALRKIWPQMVKKSDCRIVLSHLGEEMSRMLPDSFPGCNVVINGHRKNMTEASATVNNALLMQFGFAGKNLSWAHIGPHIDNFFNVKTGWIPVTPDIPDDSAILKIVQPEEKTVIPSGVADLYIMSKCPYGLKALREFTESMVSFSGLEWHVWFIGSIDHDNSLSSLHGKNEMTDETYWLAVQNLYPQQWFWFLKARSVSNDVPVDTIITRMGLNLDRIKDWVDRKGKAELSIHYDRSMHLGITASPTLLLNNAPYDIEMSKPRISKTLCGQFGRISTYCDSVPECIDDNDCRKKGMVGTCIKDQGKARCTYKEAVHFNFTVIMPDSLFSHPEREIIATTKDLFEGAVIETLSIKSVRGRQLFDRFAPKALPYYLFDKKASEAYNYPKIETGLVSVNDYLVFKEGYVKKAYFYKRPLIPASCEIFIDPMFQGAKEALDIALKKRSRLKVGIMPVLTAPPDLDSIPYEDRIRREEAQRWLLILKKYSSDYVRYLKLFVKREDSSYWFLALQELKINIDEFVKNIKTDKGSLHDLWKTQTELGISGPVEVLIDNREVVRIKNPKELSETIEALDKR